MNYINFDLAQWIYNATSAFLILALTRHSVKLNREFYAYRDQANMFMAGMYNLAEKTEQTPGMP